MFGNNNSGLGAGIGNNNLIVYPQKTCNITPNPQSTLLSGGSVITLSNSETVTPTFSYVLTQAYFPTLSGASLASIDYIGAVGFAGNNSGGSTRTVNYRVKLTRGGVTTDVSGIIQQSVNTTNHIYSLWFRSFSHNNALLDCAPQVGDQYDVYAWCTESATDVTLIRYGLTILPIRFKPVNNPNKLLMNTVYTVGNAVVPNFSNQFSGFYNLYKYFCGSTGFIGFTSAIPSVLFDAEHPIYGLATSQGDLTPSNFAATNPSTSYTPTQYCISQITWRETNIRNLGT